MNATISNCISELQTRGLVAQVTDIDGLKARMSDGPKVVYCGFDPTADSLHVGSLGPLITLRRLQLAGHCPIALVGGATGLIGDPSGKATERQLNDASVVQIYSERLRQQIEPFLDFDGSSAARMVNNLDWFGGMGALTFLREIGKHVTVNTMLSRDAVKNRLDRQDIGISYTEFSYGLLQAYDAARLWKDHGCELQIGGSDQWGNIVGGVDLTRRLHGKTVFGLTMPLVVKADGNKFGKSEEGNIWLSPLKTSPYSFYQFWLNAADEDVAKFLCYFTFMSVNEINELVASDRLHVGRPQAQRALAEQVTTLVHGRAALQSAQRISAALFSCDPAGLTESDFVQLSQDGLPTTTVANDTGIMTELLVSTGLADSKSHARQLLQAKAVSLNGHTVAANDEVRNEHRLFGRYALLQRGSKKHALVQWA